MEEKNLGVEISDDPNLYKKILGTMSEGVFILKKLGKIIPLNDNVEKILGVKSGFFTEASLKDLERVYVTEDGSPLLYSELPGVITQERGISFDNFILGVKENDEISKWVSVNSTPLHLADDEPAALLTFSDITLQKKQELMLRGSYVFQKELINKLERGIVVTDKNKRIKLMNQSFYDMMGLEGEMDLYIGRYAPDIDDLFDKQINKVEEKLNGAKYTEEFEKNNERVIKCNFFPFYSDRKCIGYIWEFEDITEWKKMKRAIVQSKEQAEKANMAKSDFLSKMSHELRTPLNGILGFAQLLEADDSLNELQSDFVQEILNGGRHLLSLINEILDLSKIETGLLQVTIEELNLLAVVQECIKILQPLAQKKKISMHIQQLDQWKDVSVLADPIRLRQIFLNLLDNAIKYNREGGEVNIIFHLTGNELVTHIVDTGEGFSAEESNKVFVPFYRIEGSREEGTGIGLSLVRQLINLMGGKIAVTSQKGIGSDFYFSLLLPNDQKAVMRWEEQVASPETKVDSTDHYRILYIEDNESNLHLVHNILKAQPSYTLLSARSGKEGLEKAAQERVDLILLDINLPDIHGYEVFDILKTRDELKDIPVLAVSANAMPQDIQYALDKGFANYLIKPLNVKEFLSTLNETLNSAINQNIPDHQILSKGPHGEKAVSAKTLQLSFEDLKRLKEKKYRAAIAMHYTGNDWSRAQVEGLQSTFNKMGIEVAAVTDAEFKSDKQAADIETILDLKPDILVSIPVDPVLTAHAYQKAGKAGLKLVFMDNTPKGLQPGKDYVSMVSADNYGNGIEAAHIMAKKLDGKGKIGVVYHDADFFATQQRTEAFERTLKEEYPDMHIVDRVGITDPRDGEKAATAMMEKQRDLNGIFVVWDVPAMGVLHAARKAGRNDLVITTIDLGSQVALEIAQDGLIKGIGAQLPYQQGVAEAILAGYALLGKPAPSYVAVPALKVTRENIIGAWKLVYNQEAPDAIKNATKQGGTDG
ncbi:substrate-binding domain-containing protein [Ammoniphilus sp. YIM 78166]|uniref:substrate-binding domain-containing protein n=1 Tax=Ammoniphilus sp. YIM 78166 TaxID=1644106 RepID=UPI001F10BDA8|nr:substrate-binding domain-containing protein [Ammoniphilus sp. YIM 78166]